MIQSNFSDKIETYIREMPSLPVSVGKVLEICNIPSVNPSDLNKVISLDPVLTGKLLKLINSAYYGLSTHITSLVRAITMLGINTVKNLALSTAILSTLSKNKEVSGLNMEGYWRHCLCVAVTSKLLAIKQGIDPKLHQEYFTAGLLHDIGKIPLNAVFTQEYMQTVAFADREHKQFFLAENECMGINHCYTGEMVARAWKLDNSVSDVISFHHDIPGYSGGNLHILCNVAIANYFSIIYEIGFAGNRKLNKPEKKIWQTTKIKPEIFEDIKDNVNEEIERAKIFLSI